MLRGSELSFPNKVLPHKSAPPFYTDKLRQERASTCLCPNRTLSQPVLCRCVWVCARHTCARTPAAPERPPLHNFPCAKNSRSAPCGDGGPWRRQRSEVSMLSVAAGG